MTQQSTDFPTPLVSTDWLAVELGAPDLRIIDGSWRMPGQPSALGDHQQRRLPGAVHFDIDAIADHTTGLPHMLPAPDVFARAVGALGVRTTDRVVIYDDAGLFSAARVWWTFRAMGHGKVSVLNGGLPKWKKEGRALDAGLAAPAPAVYAIPPGVGRVRDAAGVRAALGASNSVVLDARPAPRFSGEATEPRPGLRRGHMPDAASLPHSLLINTEGEMIGADELALLFRARGVSKDTRVIASCGSGVTAAVLCLALERLGHADYALYDGSWAEWGKEANDPALFPVATG